VNKADAVVAMFIDGFASKAANMAAAEVIRERLGASIESAIPEGTEVVWDAIGAGQRKVIRFELPGAGYAGGDAAAAASWAEACCKALLAVFEAHPVADLAELVAERTGPHSSDDMDDDE
jgi:hypothetical protein